jgi:response regulator NasT
MPTRIVLADDEAIIRMDLKEMLTSLGYVVVGEAGDGRTAINVAREVRPDLVIMDVQMPDLDGIAAAEEMASEQIAPVPLLTAYSQPELVERARETAAIVGYLVKPFRESDLAPAIEVALARHREFRTIQGELRDIHESLETRKVVERAKGLLMDAHGLKEAEAFRKIQKLSMNARKSMREVAEAILLTNEL